MSHNEQFKYMEFLENIFKKTKLKIKHISKRWAWPETLGYSGPSIS